MLANRGGGRADPSVSCRFFAWSSTSRLVGIAARSLPGRWPTPAAIAGAI